MVALTFSASTDSLRGIKPRVSSFGADQFDEADMEEVPKKYVFFNWFIFAINMGAILGITVLVYVREKKGWALGFGLPTRPMVISIIILAAGIPSKAHRQCRSFHLLGQLEFFYDEATDGTSSNSSAVFLSEIGIGIWLSTATVKIIESPAGGEDKGWLRINLNKSRLDYFYRELTVINAVDFVVYLWISAVYKGRGGAAGTVRDEGVVDMGDDHGASMEKDED
ncbi:hypothetical protein OIU78_012767 [Salix suchowensis]|nr:hypothetical protein OIU78_012767 [Salix suchowensis]